MVAVNPSVVSKSSSNALRLTDRLVAQLQTDIIKGVLAPGSKINEQALAEHFKISRGPAREAILTLEQQRLVAHYPHVGAKVTQLTVIELNELYQLRSVLESMACELAAKHINQAQLTALNQLVEQQYALLNHPDPYFQLQGDVDFHYLIIQASDNHHLQQTLIGNLYYLLRMYRYQTASHKRPAKAIAEHQAILDAITVKDGELAALLMRRHIEKGRISTEQKLIQMQSPN